MPVQSFDSSVVQHQLKGSVTRVLILFSLPSVATIPTKRKKKNMALDACRLSGLSICQLCGTSFWVWGYLTNSTTPNLSCDSSKKKAETKCDWVCGACRVFRPSNCASPVFNSGVEKKSTRQPGAVLLQDHLSLKIPPLLAGLSDVLTRH